MSIANMYGDVDLRLQNVFLADIGAFEYTRALTLPFY